MLLPQPWPNLENFSLSIAMPSRPLIDTEPDIPSPSLDGDVTFADLGISPDLLAVLAKRGMVAPFPVQALTIPDALAGRDVCGKAQTGSGKTLAFGLPLIERTKTAKPRRPHAIVLVPTRELANQVAEELTPFAAARGLWLCAIYGGTSMFRQIQALRQGVDIVIATPGRLNDLLDRGEMSVSAVKNVVLDEADQMADMGFLPQVERILGQIEGETQTLLFSATLDGAIRTLVQRYQKDPVRHEVASTQATVDTLEQRFIGVTSESKVEIASRISAGAKRVLLFVRTTHGADRLAEQLGRTGLRAAAIHGRLSQSKRERTLADFAHGSVPVLVATNVAARGLHVDGIDVVIHYDPPEDHKVYLHRSGRTARAGESGMVVTLVLPIEEHDVTAIERAAGIDVAIVRMAADDERLLDLATWNPPRGLPETASYSRGRTSTAPARNGGGSRRPGRGGYGSSRGGYSRR